jgi:eukaryotic-like serine/threonine-protein kinase
MSTRLTRVGTLIGTPTYMAPEQVRSRGIDARTDIYSLGVIMYELFAGRPPYMGDDMAVLFQHVEGNPVPPRQANPDLPPALEEIILKAMAVDPEQRFQSVDELRRNLMGFIRQR